MFVLVMQACMSSFKKQCDLYSHFKQVCFNFHLPYLKFSRYNIDHCLCGKEISEVLRKNKSILKMNKSLMVLDMMIIK